MPEILKTVCNRDCPDACTLSVTVENGRAIHLTGDRDDPVTQGFLCERTQKFLFRQYSDDRLLRPLVRRDGKLVPISWDDALDLAAEKLETFRRESGPESILHYRSGGSLGMLKHVSSVLFARFGPVAEKSGDICSGAGEAAQVEDFGVSESHDLFDLMNSRTIIVWGKNPHTSGVHLLPILREARARGTKILGVDPVRTKATTLCDRFVMPKPAADHAVALGMARWLFDHDSVPADVADYAEGLDGFRALAYRRDVAGWAREADVPEEDVVALAEAYADGPAAILVGWGMGRRRNGSQAVRLLDALGVISGNMGVPGGGVSFYFGRRSAFDCDFGLDVPPPSRTLSEPRLGPDLLEADPPVRMIWVTAGNPVSMLPDSASVRRGFERSEFNVVVDTHPTDTTDVADLVLPTLTLLEDEDLLGAFGNHWLRASRPVLEAPGEARHELEILQGLARRLGLGDEIGGSVRDLKRRAMQRLEAQGVTLEDIEAGPVKNPFVGPVLFADRRFPTPGGKARLVTRLDEPAAGDSAYPLSLMAVSSPKAQSSQWSVPLNGAPEVRVHPSAANGFGDGDLATLESAVGALEVSVRLDERVRPEIALMDKGGMMRQDRCANALIRAELTDAGEGGALYDEPVRLRK